MDNCPYKGLIPYMEGDTRYFFGRDTERRIIADNLRATRLTVLYGPSAVGKSSVLNAGVAHDLQDDPDYILRVFRDWRGDLGRFLDDLERDAATAEGSEAADHTLLVVLDQFEEYFQYHPKHDGESPFLKQLVAIFNRCDLPIHFLLSIREDSLAALDRFKTEVPTLLDNRLGITFLSREAACEAIVKPLQRFNEDLHGRSVADNKLHPIEIDEKLAAEVVKEIVEAQGEEHEGVQTAYLQLVMKRWWEREMQGNSAQMLATTLREQLGGVRKIVERYLEDTIATLSPEEKELASEVFHYLVTSAGRKIAQTVSELGASTYVGEKGIWKMLDGLLDKLQRARVLASVPPPRGSRRDERCYEFAHDVVAKAALDWKKQFRQAQEMAKTEASLAEERSLRKMYLSQALAAKALLEELHGEQERSALLAARAHSLYTEARAQRGARSGGASLLDIPGFPGTLYEVFQEILSASHFSHTLGEHSSEVAGVAFSPNGLTLATASYDGTIRLWDLNRPGKSDPVVLRVDSAQFSAVAFHPKNKDLVAGSLDGAVRIFKGGAAVEIGRHDGHVRSVTFSPDGTQIVSAGDNGAVLVWDLANPGKNVALIGHYGTVWSVAASPSPNGAILATAGQDGKIRLWNLSRQERRPYEELSVPGGRDPEVFSISFSPDESMLASGSDDGKVRLWYLQHSSEPASLEGHEDAVRSVAFCRSSSQTVLASGSNDQTVRLWDWRRPESKSVILCGPSSGISSVALSDDGGMLAAGYWNRHFRVWTLKERKCNPALLKRYDLKAKLFSVAFSADGKWLASGDESATVQVWRTDQSGAGPTMREQYSQPVRAVAFHPDRPILASGSYDRKVRIWDLREPQSRILGEHPGGVTSLSFASDGSTLASASRDGTVCLWDPNTLTRRLEVPSFHKSCIWTLAVSPDGKWLATGGDDRTVRLWNLEGDSRAARILGRHEMYVRAAAFSRDGKLLASGSRDGTVRLWHVHEPEKEPIILRGFDLGVGALAFSLDSKTLAIAGWDHTVQLRDVDFPTAAPIILKGHRDGVSSLAFSPADGTLASGSYDRAIILWKVDIDAVNRDAAGMALARVWRALTKDERDEFVGPMVDDKPTCQQDAELAPVKTVTTKP